MGAVDRIEAAIATPTAANIAADDVDNARNASDTAVAVRLDADVCASDWAADASAANDAEANGLSPIYGVLEARVAILSDNDTMDETILPGRRN